jgi:hypothetical protein
MDCKAMKSHCYPIHAGFLLGSLFDPEDGHVPPKFWSTFSGLHRTESLRSYKRHRSFDGHENLYAQNDEYSVYGIADSFSSRILTSIFVYDFCRIKLSWLLRVPPYVVYWLELLATDPEVQVRFPATPDFLRSS